jgi:hypothetical protein
MRAWQVSSLLLSIRSARFQRETARARAAASKAMTIRVPVITDTFSMCPPLTMRRRQPVVVPPGSAGRGKKGKSNEFRYRL